MNKILEKPLTKKLIAEIKELRLHAKERKRQGAFIAEGIKIVNELLIKKADITHIVYDMHKAEYAEEFHQMLVRAHGQGIHCFSALPAIFAKASSLKTPQGVLARVKIPSFDLDEILNRSRFLLCIGDNIQDPANAGLLVRNALAFGIDGIIFTNDSSDVYGPKAVRAAAGAILDEPVFYRSIQDISKIRSAGACFYAADMKAKNTMRSIKNIGDKSAIVFGNEGRGLSNEMTKQVDKDFSIPISEKIESLNVTSAAAITMHHFSNLKKPQSAQRKQ